MKTFTSLLATAVFLAAASAATAAETTVYVGAVYDVVIEDGLSPMDVGLPNPGGENLVGVMLKIRNMRGTQRQDPGGFNGVDGALQGIYTDGPGLHNQKLMTTPTLDQEMATTVATLIDSHFNFLSTEVLFVGTPPSETNDLAPSVEPTDAVGGWAAMATCDFGNRLFGNFSMIGGAAGDVDQDGDPTTWSLAWLAVPVGTTVYMNFNVTGIDPGEVIEGAFTVPVPEPATMSLLAIGGLGALIRRRTR